MRAPKPQNPKTPKPLSKEKNIKFNLNNSNLQNMAEEYAELNK
jgi:hypothetical protein